MIKSPIHFLFITILCGSFSGMAQDSLRLEVTEYKVNEAMVNFMKATQDSGVFILTCKAFDDELMKLNNEYRVSKGLKELLPNIRLDSLAKKQVYFMHLTKQFQHYTNIEQMKPYRDLLGYENIASKMGIGWYHERDLLLNPIIEYQIRQSWIESPPHNRNLLVADEAANSTAVASMIVLWFKKKPKQYYWIAYIVYEADGKISKRDKNEVDKQRTRTWVAKKK